MRSLPAQKARSQYNIALVRITAQLAEAAKAASELAQALAAESDKSELSSENCESHDIKRRKFREVCPRIEGAYRVGRVWYVSSAAWREYHRALADTKPDESGEVDTYEVAVRKGARR
ncbi:MAG: hypothetical protein U0174_23120 [Polyangiaceae bacterium]